jgi:hypothetical protein
MAKLIVTYEIQKKQIPERKKHNSTYLFKILPNDCTLIIAKAPISLQGFHPPADSLGCVCCWHNPSAYSDAAITKPTHRFPGSCGVS